MKVFIETCFGFRTFPLLKLLNLSLTVNADVFDPKLNNEHALLLETPWPEQQHVSAESQAGTEYETLIDRHIDSYDGFIP